MKANNLSISLPGKACNKDCPYCISKITTPINDNAELFERNLNKVKKFAEMCNVTSVSITGKGEPTLSNRLTNIIKYFSEFPVELQTNGIRIQEEARLPEVLYKAGLNTIAFSIDSFNDIYELQETNKECCKLGIITRATINITKSVVDRIESIDTLIDAAIENNFDQLSIRQVTIPTANIEDDNPAVKWIKENVDPNDYEKFNKQIGKHPRAFKIRTLPYGSILYDIDGLSVTSFDYCIQDNSSDDDIRSLIYQGDGHLYTSWNSKASIIF
jgi:MoaA/NifB/PqqE/SkfB family radical SAM enzyme